MLDAKHSMVKKIQVGSDEGQLLSPMGNYYEIANLKKNVCCRTDGHQF